MSNAANDEGFQLRSTVTEDGTLELSLSSVPIPEPKPHEVVVRIEATPLNPSDLALLLGGADPSTAESTGSKNEPRTTLKLNPALMRAHAGRVGQPLPIGNEGAGVVVKAGSSEAAQALLGKTVSVIGGGMYTQYRCLAAGQCQPLPEGTTAADGASWFINPMTALGMIETMRREEHTALVHTAAASNLGQMLQKACLEDGIGLVNIVRKPQQAALLRDLGATHVCDSSTPTFMQDLIEAVSATGATLAFDAIGGGKLVGQILTAMEVAASRKQGGPYSVYGTDTYKQAYIYGSLDPSPTVIGRTFGMTWGVGGWLLTPFIQKAGDETIGRLRTRIAKGLKTTFASKHAGTISLQDALSPERMAVYATQATGEKYLIDPTKD